MKKRQIIFGLTGLFLLVSGICYSCTFHNKNAAVLIPGQDAQGIQESNDDGISSTASERSLDKSAAADVSQTEDLPLIYVHICGEVIQPGVYQVQEGARLIDVIALSGGLTKEAAGDYVNQAEQVSDGQRYYIPSTEDVKDLSGNEYMQGIKSNTGESKEACININTATKEELMSLPGIGEAKAGSIIAYRDANGAFQATEELMNIPGIKEGLYNQISSMISIK